MAKRGVSFADSVETRTFANDDTIRAIIDEEERPTSSRAPGGSDDEEDVPKKKSKHTLDSDEEDNADHDELDMEKVEGQEDECELDFEGNTKITAFNMKEDMEDGHFDSTGNFIFNKKEKEIHDAWLDDIDWASIKKKAGDQWEKDGDNADDDAPPVLNDVRRREIFTELLALLKPELTITRALAEIKKSKGLSAAEERKLRWAAKKAGKAFEPSDGQKDTAKLSALADELISAGHMDAYEWTRERIDLMLKKLDSTASDSLDMFSDEPAPATAGASSAAADDDEVKWEYKENEEGKITGPFTSAEMAARQDKGELGAKGLARKVGSGAFNPVARIDFDLYC